MKYYRGTLFVPFPFSESFPSSESCAAQVVSVGYHCSVRIIYFSSAHVWFSVSKIHSGCFVSTNFFLEKNVGRRSFSRHMTSKQVLGEERKRHFFLKKILRTKEGGTVLAKIRKNPSIPQGPSPTLYRRTEKNCLF